MLLRALLAAFMGTAATTLSSTVEMDARGRDPSTVPGRAANKLLSLFGIPELKGPSLHVVSDVTHWVYGTAWGVVFSPRGRGRALPGRGPAFLLIVWGTAQAQLPLLRIALPGGSGGQGGLIEWHHAVYVAATGGGGVLIDVAAA
jgi:hypothetical protein